MGPRTRENGPQGDEQAEVDQLGGGAWWGAQEAAAWLGITDLRHVRTLAHRDHWRRRYRGRRVEYAAADVDDTRERRALTPR